MNVYQIIQQQKWFPFIFVMTYTEIHFSPSFILSVQSAELNHLLHDSFALQRGKFQFFREFHIF